MPPSEGRTQARLPQLYDSHPFESNLSTLYQLDRDASFSSQRAGTSRTDHSKPQGRLELLNGIAHILAKSADPEKSRIAVGAFRSGAETTRGCPHTTVVYCKDTPCSPELKRYIFRVLWMLRVAQREPVSKCSNEEKWRLNFVILKLEVVPWCWKRIYVLAGELKVALEGLKEVYLHLWDKPDRLFIGNKKAAELKAEEGHSTVGQLVVNIEQSLSQVLELSVPADCGRKHCDARKRRDYLWKNWKPIYHLLIDCEDLNDLVKSSADSDDTWRAPLEKKMLWEVMSRIAALATYTSTTARLSYFATRPSGRTYVDFSKVKITEVPSVPPPHRVCIPSEPTWVVNELHARKPQGKHPGDPYTQAEIKTALYNSNPLGSPWDPQPKTKDIERITCREHPEVTIARETLSFYSPVGRPNSVIRIFIGTSSESCVMCRRYLDLLEQECAPPLPNYPLKPAPRKRRVCFVISKYSQRPLMWQMPEGSSEVMMEKMTEGLEKDLDMIVQRLRNYWGYRRRKPKPPKLRNVDELCQRFAVWGGLGSMARPRRVGLLKRLGLMGIQEAAAGEGKGIEKDIEKVDEVEGNGKTSGEEATAVSRREVENGKEQSDD
ncbi:hypothetical protein BGX38DRAFT_1227355 [Terfezia claveryi]|nr:hypothetical protein BGX38DRAFT_1227355 [Terfezia claveryi]